jgi:membrane dipeptidase
MLDVYPEAFTLASTADDVARIHGEGRVASLMGVEGGHQINGSLGTLRTFYRLGVRYMTLTHSDNVPWADSGTDAAQANGLTDFGESIVREMNRIGMLVDLSHTSEPTVMHVLRITRAPVIFSHSSCRALTDHPRNVSDDVLRALPANGGVIMITFVPAFTSLSAGDRGARELAERLRLEKEWGKGDLRIDNAMRTWSLKNPRPKSSLREVADHVEHARKVAGPDHVGLGSDFDGISDVPEGLEDVSRFKDLVVDLLRRGWSDADLRKLLGENVLRVMRAAEKAAEHRGG